MLTQGAQTVVGAQTFSAAAIFSSTITPTGGFTTSLLSDTDNTDSLGSDSVSFVDLFLDGSIKHGATACITMNSIGATTQATQPSFLAMNTTSTADVTGDGTTATIDFDTERFDKNGDFASDTLTAPLDSIWHLATQVRATGIVTGHTQMTLNIITSNRTYQIIQDMNEAIAEQVWNQAVDADMDANDTSTVTFVVSGGTKVVDIGGNASVLRTYFSGVMAH